MAIQLSNVQFSYPEHTNSKVLNIQSWSLAMGENTFIYGPSGCGKSTLLSLLNGLLTPCEGEVTVLGKRLDKMSKRQRDTFRANNIGYVFQQFNLIPYLNAIENIRLANYFAKPKARPEAKTEQKSSLEKDINHLLTTLNMPETDWEKPVRTLSIGQQQRIAIARALINKPMLLIADEPTSSLDKDNTDSFMAVLMSLVNKYGITLLFVSHDISLSSYFNRVESFTDMNHVELLNHVN